MQNQTEQLIKLLNQNIVLMKEFSLFKKQPSNDDFFENTFVYQLIALLLTRMHDENRYSNDNNHITDANIKPFDIVRVEHVDGMVCFCLVYNVVVNVHINSGYVAGFNVLQLNNGKYEQMPIIKHYLMDCYIRTITKEEASLFRHAMECIYANQ